MSGTHLHERLATAAAHHEQGRQAEAELGYRAVLAAQPDHADALHLLGVLLAQTGRPGEGEPLVARAAALSPGAADMQVSLGTIRRALGRHDGAVAALRTALTLHPGSAQACLHLGALLQESGQKAEAESLLTRAVAADDSLGEGWYRLALLAEERGEAGRAVTCLERALELDLRPSGPVLARLLRQLGRLARWDQIDALLPTLPAAVEADRTGAIPPDLLIGQPLVAEWHLRAARAHAASLVVAPVPARPAAAARNRLRIGYVAADIAPHAAALRVIAAHDRRVVEPLVFTLGPIPHAGDLSQPRATSLAGLTADAAAGRLRVTDLDVLVDLDGFGPGTNPAILARRPAPVIVHWPGHPGSLGGLADYLLADPVVIPQGRERFYAEAVVRLPGCHIPPQPVSLAPAPSRQDLRLPGEAVVFCAFHATERITRTCFAGWLRILTACPDAVLWLLPPAAETARTFLGAAAQAGIDPRRVIFLTQGGTPLPFGAADLFLDTRPVSAARQAACALAAGLPVLTCLGDSFAGRAAAGILTAAGLPDLIAPSAPAYEATAIALAHDRRALAEVRGRLTATCRTPDGPFAAAPTARALEAAFRVMADRAAAGQPPVGFTLQVE